MQQYDKENMREFTSDFLSLLLELPESFDRSRIGLRINNSQLLDKLAQYLTSKRPQMTLYELKCRDIEADLLCAEFLLKKVERITFYTDCHVNFPIAKLTLLPPQSCLKEIEIGNSVSF